MGAVSLTLSASLLLLAALICLYVSLRNQLLLVKPLGRIGRYAGGSGVLLSLSLMAEQGVVGVFTWLATLMVLLVLIPALAFGLRRSVSGVRGSR
ncbi:MAG: hypothetical protein LRY66_04570 [Saccharospirillaceae bacterium]|nr:hypothetical protein [Saccharospirillaceae bacterium]MCD8530632.1 hypothetical protein [Saccharospirillaceae bacterium]